MTRLTASLFLAAIPAVLGAQSGVPDYSSTPRAQVPDAYKWKTTDLFPTEEAWRASLAQLKQETAGLDVQLKGWTATPQAMADLKLKLTDLYVRLLRLSDYASLQSDMDMSDARFQKMKGEVQDLFVGLGSKLASMESDVLKLGHAKVDEYLKAEPRLGPFRLDLHRTLRQKDHILPEGEERVMAMTGLFASTPDKVAGLLNDVDIPRPEVTLADGTKVILTRANYGRYRTSKNPADRRLVMETYWNAQKKYENAFAALFDGEMKKHLFSARVRNYPSCLDAALFGDAIDPAVYRNLISTVRANLAPLHRYVKLKQRLLGLKEFHYHDLFASAVAAVNRTYTFDQARKLSTESMAVLGPEYQGTVAKAFDSGWIDIYPNQAKQAGAYSEGVLGVHPFVKMNFIGTYDSVSTLSHELGHAMHSHLSFKTQHPAQAYYPTFLAEIASTFNENQLLRHMLKEEKDDQLKLYLLDSYLDGARATLYRQTLFAEFELAMHERVESGQSLTPDWMNQKYLELSRTYYGHDKGVMVVDDYLQNEWSGVPHFFMNYYVFQYATGLVASTALAEDVAREGEPARKRYIAFLSAGGSKYPLEILKDAGLDMSTPRPVEAALKGFDRLVGEMEAIVNRLGK